MDELQRIENSVYRQILGAPKYTQIPTLRGEIGSSTMENRIRTNQLLYVKYIEDNNQNQLLKRILEEKKVKKEDYWVASTKEFMDKICLSYEKLKTGTKFEIKKHK